jgi:hypothetical protein
MGIALLVLGAVAALVGGLMVLVAAFRTGVLWGLACLLVPFAGLVYVLTHWEESRTGFLLNLAGLAVVALGVLFQPSDSLFGGGALATESWREPAPPAWEQPERQDPGATSAPAWQAPAPAWQAPSPGFGREDDAAAPAVSEPPPPPSQPPRREEAVSPYEAGAHLGRLVTVIQVEGKPFKARLRAVQGGVLYFERPIGGGSVTFPMPAERIVELRAMRSAH